MCVTHLLVVEGDHVVQASILQQDLSVKLVQDQLNHLPEAPLKLRAGPGEGPPVLVWMKRTWLNCLSCPGKRNLQDPQDALWITCDLEITRFSRVFACLFVCSAKWSCSAQHLQREGASDPTFAVNETLPTPARKHQAGFGFIHEEICHFREMFSCSAIF